MSPDCPPQCTIDFAFECGVFVTRVRGVMATVTILRCRDMRDDLVDTVIAPAGAEAAAGLLADARENTARVSKYLQRYKEVQERRSNMEVCLLCMLHFWLRPAIGGPVRKLFCGPMSISLCMPSGSFGRSRGGSFSCAR